MTTDTATYTLLFEKGEGDRYWNLEERNDGVICFTTNADTRRPVTPESHRGWDADQFREDLARDGVPDELIDRILSQANLD